MRTHRSTSVPRLGASTPPPRTFVQSPLLDPAFLPSLAFSHLPHNDMSPSTPLRNLARSDSGASLYTADSESDDYERRSSRRGRRRCRRSDSAASSQPSSCASYSWGATCSSSGYGSSDYLATAESEIDQLLIKDNGLESTNHLISTATARKSGYYRETVTGAASAKKKCSAAQPAVPDTLQNSRVPVWPGDLWATNLSQSCCCEHCPIKASHQQLTCPTQEENEYATIGDVMSDKELALARERCVPPALPPRNHNLDCTDQPLCSRSRERRSGRNKTSGCFANVSLSADSASSGAAPCLRHHTNSLQSQEALFLANHLQDFVHLSSQLSHHHSGYGPLASSSHCYTRSASLNESCDSLVSTASKKSLKKEYSVSEVLSSIQRLGCDSADCTDDFVQPNCSTEEKPPRPKKPAHMNSTINNFSVSNSVEPQSAIRPASVQPPTPLVYFLEESHGILC